jgi:hypothetical protein
VRHHDQPGRVTAGISAAGLVGPVKDQQAKIHAAACARHDPHFLIIAPANARVGLPILHGAGDSRGSWRDQENGSIQCPEYPPRSVRGPASSPCATHSPRTTSSARASQERRAKKAARNRNCSYSRPQPQPDIAMHSGRCGRRSASGTWCTRPSCRLTARLVQTHAPAPPASAQLAPPNHLVQKLGWHKLVSFSTCWTPRTRMLRCPKIRVNSTSMSPSPAVSASLSQSSKQRETFSIL